MEFYVSNYSNLCDLRGSNTFSSLSVKAWFNLTFCHAPPRAYSWGFANFFFHGGLFPTPGHANRDNSPPPSSQSSVCTVLKSPWILGGVLKKSLNFIFRWKLLTFLCKSLNFLQLWMQWPGRCFFMLFVCPMGYSRKNLPPPRWKACWKISQEGG